MNVKELKNLIKDLPDDTIIEINTIWDKEENELKPSSVCEAHYNEQKKKIYITPEKILYI